MNCIVLEALTVLNQYVTASHIKRNPACAVLPVIMTS